MRETSCIDLFIKLNRDVSTLFSDLTQYFLKERNNEITSL